MTTTYEYEPLPSPDYIRVATILPGEFDDDIVLNLFNRPFKDESIPQFEALSYAWGSEDDQPLINIGATAKLRVTKNLEEALRYIRLTNLPRDIWIDAICINQSDSLEKSVQVAKMGEIYQRAMRVVVWLGPEADDSTYCLESFDAVGSLIEIDSKRLEGNFAYNKTTIIHRLFLDAEISTEVREYSRLLLAIYQLLSRSWFSRLWVRQEITLANRQAILQCGSCQVLWDHFRKATFVLSFAEGRRAAAGLTLIEGLFTRLKSLDALLLEHRRLSIFTIGDALTDTQCRDPRDRIYALLALMKPSDRTICGPPDYSATYQEIYLRIARKAIEFGSLDLLTRCGGSHESPNTLPSWVPPWNTDGPQWSVPQYGFASSRLYTSARISESSVLQALGVTVCTVTSLQPFPSLSQMRLEDQFQAWGCFIRATDTDWSSQYPTGIAKTEAWARTLLEDGLLHMRLEDHSFPSLESAMQVVEQMLPIGGQPENAKWADTCKFLHTAHRRTERQFLFAGSGGYMGTTPMGVQAGDLVCVVVGCDMPLLLRPVDGGRRHLIVGQCSTTGIMDGQALLGPLPHDVHPCFVYDEKFKGHVLAYKHADTGSLSPEDPRFSDLPVDLAEYRQKLEENPRVRLDIKPDVLRELLRERGVDLQWLSIV